MRKITKMISLLVAVLMEFGARSISEFAISSIHIGTGGRDTSIVSNPRNIHKEYIDVIAKNKLIF